MLFMMFIQTGKQHPQRQLGPAVLFLFDADIEHRLQCTM